MTLGELFEAWQAEHRPKLRPRPFYESCRLLAREVPAELFSKPADDITRREVVALLDA